MFGDLVLSEINESQKEQILCGSTHRVVKFIQIESRKESRRSYLMYSYTEFQFCKKKRVPEMDDGDG